VPLASRLRASKLPWQREDEAAWVGLASGSSHPPGWPLPTLQDVGQNLVHVLVLTRTEQFILILEGGHMNTPKGVVVLLLVGLLPTGLIAETVTIPSGTLVYGSIAERVTSRKKETSTGDLVRAFAWKDVKVDGRIVVEAGAPMVVKVGHVKKANFAGIKGKLELEAVSVVGLDGTEIPLSGGYDKSGKGRKALSITLAALVVWPAIFIKGKQAVLEDGTVFDAAVAGNSTVELGGSPTRTIKIAKDLQVEVLYDKMDPDGKSKLLPIRLNRCEGPFSKAAVITVNEQRIEEIPISLGQPAIVNECHEIHGDIDLKALAKHFTRGINRFEIEVDGTREEVILDIEM